MTSGVCVCILYTYINTFKNEEIKHSLSLQSDPSALITEVPRFINSAHIIPPSLCIFPSLITLLIL